MHYKEKFDEQSKHYKEKFDEQNKRHEELMDILKQIKDDMPEIGQAPDFTMVGINNDLLLFV